MSPASECIEEMMIGFRKSNVSSAIVAGIVFASALIISPAETGVSMNQTKQMDKEREAAACAEDLMAEARKATCDTGALQDIKSLSASCQLRRHVKYISVQSQTKIEEREKIINGKAIIEFLFPDKFRKRVTTSTLLGYRYSYSEIVNGTRAWRDPPLPVATSNKDRHVIDVSDFEKSLSYQAETARQQLMIYSLEWLLRKAPGRPLDLRCLGWVNIGGEKADAIATDGGEEFQPLFLINKTSHLPMGFASSFIATRGKPIIVEAATLDPRYRRALVSKAMQVRAEHRKPPERLNMQMLFSDHRRVDGILLPHHVSTLVNDQVVEEIIIARFEINRPMNPKIFEPKPSVRGQTR